ncbi:MAG: SET domain-containing protein-lysine N-methyltransferase [Candidatus Zixiibacteriota bacterium]
MSRRYRPLLSVRNSRIQGRGVFALRRIRKGQRVIEYLGERISHDEAEERYDEYTHDFAHTFLFTVDEKTVIDGARRGNAARFINHSCDPNCESLNDDGHIVIEAIKNIQPGVELTYDYHLDCEGPYGRAWRKRYACLCGSRICRGTLLRPPKRRNGHNGNGRSGNGKR